MDGQISIFDMMYKEYRIDTPIRLIELFAGYGSQAMALRNIGADFEHYRMIEFDDFAVASYNAVHGTEFVATDIRDVSGGDLGIIDKESFTYLLTYSFPCTDISLAGRRQGMAKGSDTRSSLLWEVERLLEELKVMDSLPQVLLMENVTAVHGAENKVHFSAWLKFLMDLGYTTFVKDLNASDFGIPQNRDRCFALSILGEYNYRFPETMELNYCVEDYFEELTDEQALQLVVKSEKAMDLMVNLDEEGKLE